MAKKTTSARLKRLTPQEIRTRYHHLMEATILANDLFKDSKKTRNWMRAINPHFFNDSPYEVILRGDGIRVLQYLEERARDKAGSAF